MRTVTTVNKCDRCGKASTTTNGGGRDLKLFRVGVAIANEDGAGRANWGASAEWCHDCCKAMGLLKARGNTKANKRSEPRPAQPTIEDMLRAIARAEAATAAGEVQERMECYAAQHRQELHPGE